MEESYNLEINDDNYDLIRNSELILYNFIQNYNTYLDYYESHFIYLNLDTICRNMVALSQIISNMTDLYDSDREYYNELKKSLDESLILIIQWIIKKDNEILSEFDIIENYSKEIEEEIKEIPNTTFTQIKNNLRADLCYYLNNDGILQISDNKLYKIKNGGDLEKVLSSNYNNSITLINDFNFQSILYDIDSNIKDFKKSLIDVNILLYKLKRIDISIKEKYNITDLNNCWQNIRKLNNTKFKEKENKHNELLKKQKNNDGLILTMLRRSGIYNYYYKPVINFKDDNNYKKLKLKKKNDKTNYSWISIFMTSISNKLYPIKNKICFGFSLVWLYLTSKIFNNLKWITPKIKDGIYNSSYILIGIVSFSIIFYCGFLSRIKNVIFNSIYLRICKSKKKK